MLVNTPRRIKFSNPHRSYWEGGHICGLNEGFGKKTDKVNQCKLRVDFPMCVYPDKVSSIRSKRNVEGLRR
jgi:hypothetical protein